MNLVINKCIVQMTVVLKHYTPPLSAIKSHWLDKSGVNHPVNPCTELEDLKQLQQGSRDAAKERPVTSSLKWPHESGHQAVGGVDFSSARHHLTPEAVYLAWSLCDTNWCRHLFALPLFGTWSSSLSCCLCLTHSLCHFLHGPLQHVSLPDILRLTLSNMIICSAPYVSSYYTLSFCVSFSVSLSICIWFFLPVALILLCVCSISVFTVHSLK